MVQRHKRRIYEILEATDPEDALGRLVNSFIMTLILLNVAAVVLESEASIAGRYGPLFDAFGIFSIIAFTVEYALRLWVSDLEPGRSDPLGGRVRFALSPLAIIDLAVILPYYLPVVFPDLRFLRGVRVSSPNTTPSFAPSTSSRWQSSRSSISFGSGPAPLTRVSATPRLEEGSGT